MNGPIMKKYNDLYQITGNTGSTGCNPSDDNPSDECLKTLPIPKPSQKELRRRWLKLMFDLDDESKSGEWKMPQKMYDDAVNQLFKNAPSKDGSDESNDCAKLEDSLKDVVPDKSSAADMATAMGVTPCKTSYNNTEVEAAVAGMIFAGGASGGHTETTSSGCEPVVIIDNINRTVTKNISCLIQKTQANLNIKGTAVNGISINGAGIKVVGNFNIGQTVSVKILGKIDVTAAFAAEIQNQLNAAATAQVAVAQSTNNKNGGVVAAGKMAQTNNTYFNSVNATKQIQDTLSSIKMSVNSNNSLEINNTSIDVGGNFTINQNSCYDIAAAMVVKATMGNIQKNIGEILSSIDSKTTQEASSTNEKQGLFDFLKDSFSFTKIIMMVVGLMVILAVIGAIVKFGTSSSDTKPPASSRPAGSSSIAPSASTRPPPAVPVGSLPKVAAAAGSLPKVAAAVSSFPFSIKRRYSRRSR